MGLAASQARLLSITARISDNELRSQTINNAKMRLATESAQASDDYVNALNKAQMMFRNMDLSGTSQSQLLTFNSLTAYSPYNTQYGLINSAGLALVSETEDKLFKQSGNDLEEYLKLHGLEWDTTYFDENTNLVSRLQSYYSDDSFKLGIDDYTQDDGLAFLFADKTSDQLKTMYENYLSQDISIEKNAYNSIQSNYSGLKREIYTSAVQDLWNALSNDGNLGQDKVVEAIKGKLGDGNIASVILKSDSPENAVNKVYCMDMTIYNDIYIGDKTKYLSDDLDTWLDSISYGTEPHGVTGMETFGAHVTIPEDLDAFRVGNGYGTAQKLGGDTTVDLNNTVMYQFGNLIVYVEAPGADENILNKNVVAVQSNTNDANVGFKFKSSSSIEQIEIKENTPNIYIGSGGGQAYEFPKSDLDGDGTADYNFSFSEFLSGAIIEYNNSSTDTTNQYLEKYMLGVTENGVQQVNISNYYQADSTIGGAAIDAAKSSIAKEIVSALTTTQSFIDIDAYIDCTAGGNSQIYSQTREDFYRLIFNINPEENSTVFQELKSDYPNLIKDIDTISAVSDFTEFIQYVHKNGADDKYTGAFQNLIDAFTVELMLDEIGEPKYTWIDTNDAGNQENAEAKAQWYTNLFNRMREGYAVIENGLASSPEWIEHAFESGIVSMEQVDKSYNWNAIDYKCCSSITENTDNTQAVALAEAKYNRAMNDIKRKDNMFDMQLKNIDTEHNALQTEYDVIKGVISKNIERTMKFDQSA